MNTKFTLNKPYSVLIPDGDSYFALPALQCLGNIKNIKIYVLSNNAWSSIRLSRYTTQFFTFPKERGDEGRLNEIMNIVKKKKIDIVLPIDIPTIRYLSDHGNELRKITSVAPYPNAETFDTVVDKWLLAEWLRVNNLPGPTTILYQTDHGFEEQLAALKFPVLIKPLKGDGGIGIKFFDNASSLLNFCKEHIRPEEFIVQSYISGYDIDCSVLCQDGNILASTIQKRIINEPLFFGPTMNIDFLNDEKVYGLVKEIIGKLEWSGVVHFDLRYDEPGKKVHVIEMNPRFWGSIVGSFYAGVNFPHLAILQGLKLDFPEIHKKPIRYVDAETAIKISFLRFIRKKISIQYYDFSKLDTHLKDPLPLFLSTYISIYKKIYRAFDKN